MFLTDWIDAWMRTRRDRQQWQVKVNQAVDDIVEIVDPRLRLLPGYRKKLAPAIIDAAFYARDIIDNLPEPIQVSRHSWSADPYLRAYFGTPDAMQEIFDNNRGLRQFIASPEAKDCSEIFAGMAMNMEEHTRMGMALSGDVVQRDVMQTTVNFQEHRIELMATSKQAFERRLLRAILEGLAAYAMQEIIDSKQRKNTLQEEQALLRWQLKVYRMRAQGTEIFSGEPQDLESLIMDLEQQLEVTQSSLDELIAATVNIEDFLSITSTLFSSARDYLRIETGELLLDRMHVKYEKAQKGVDTLYLTKVLTKDKPFRVYHSIRFSSDIVGSGEA